MQTAQWVIAASALVSALATVVLVVVTAYYVTTTRAMAQTNAAMLEEIKRSRDLALHPMVSFTINGSPHCHAAAIDSVTLRNIGNAPALRILFDIDLSIAGQYIGEACCDIGDLGVGDSFVFHCRETLNPKGEVVFQQPGASRSESIWTRVRARYANSFHLEFDREISLYYSAGSLPAWQRGTEKHKLPSLNFAPASDNENLDD